MSSNPVVNSANLLSKLSASGLYLALAESITGGALSSTLVDVPGASKVLLGSIVAYQSDLKHALVGVSRTLLENQGAVDPEVAAQMAIGAREKLANACGLSTDSVLGLATTGVAGPDFQDGKPVGLCYIAVSGPKPIETLVFEYQFAGNRAEIRAAAVTAAIQLVWEQISPE